MMRFQRRRHDRLAARHVGVGEEDSFDLSVGQRVMTPEGVVGTVIGAESGPFRGAESYEVILDDDMGGGSYGRGELVPIEHLAVEARRYSGTPLVCDDCGCTATISAAGGRDGHTMLCPDCAKKRGKTASVETEVVRGMVVEVPRDDPALAMRLIEGRATADDLLRCVNSDRNAAGRHWGIISGTNSEWDIGSSVEYAYAEETPDRWLDADGRPDGGEIAVIMIGTIPFDPSQGDNAEAFRWNYSIPDGTEVRLKELWYFANQAWNTGSYYDAFKRVPATGRTVRTGSGAKTAVQGPGLHHFEVTRGLVDSHGVPVQPRSEQRKRAARADLPLAGPGEVHTAADDYPELEDILWQRPDHVEAVPVEINTVRFSSRTAAKTAGPVRDSINDPDQPGWWRHLVAPALDRINESLPPGYRYDDATRVPSVDWCRFRRDSHCWFPKDLDEEGTRQAGYAVWIPKDRGPCPRATHAEQRVCPVGEPGPHSGERQYGPDATYSWGEGGQRRASLIHVGSLGYDPFRELPRYKPGEAPIPPGAVRLNHRTWLSNIESIMRTGLGGGFARQFDFVGEVVWAAAGPAGDMVMSGEQATSDVVWIEFWMMPDELLIENGQDPRWLEQNKAHVTMAGVPVERFVGVYLPWHSAYWSFERRDFEQVKSGYYDNIAEEYPNSYGKAIEYIKRTGSKTASTDVDRLPKTAAWADVRAKAVDIRRNGGVRIIANTGTTVTAEVRGDNDVYVTSITRVPGTKQMGMWFCACDWTKYAWARSAPYKHLEGRQCSHALALAYEIQSQEMFGGTIGESTADPGWGTPRQDRREGDEPEEYGLQTLDLTSSLTSESALLSLGNIADSLVVASSIVEGEDARARVEAALESARAAADHLRGAAARGPVVATTHVAFPAQVRGRTVDVVRIERGTAVTTSGDFPVGELMHPKWHPTIGLTANLDVAAAITREAAESVGGFGVMVALSPSVEVCQRLSDLAATAGFDAEDPSQIHLTLAYCGKTDEVDRDSFLTAVRAFAAQQTMYTGKLSGLGTFVNGDEHVLWATADIPGLAASRTALVEMLSAAGTPARTDHDFTPHITLAYAGSPIVELPDFSPLAGTELRFTTIVAAYGGEWTHIDLIGSSGETVAVETLDKAASGRTAMSTWSWSYNGTIYNVSIATDRMSAVVHGRVGASHALLLRLVLGRDGALDREACYLHPACPIEVAQRTFEALDAANPSIQVAASSAADIPLSQFNFDSVPDVRYLCSQHAAGRTLPASPEHPCEKCGATEWAPGKATWAARQLPEGTKTCPDCWGEGYILVEGEPFGTEDTCARCSGRGYVRDDKGQRSSRRLAFEAHPGLSVLTELMSEGGEITHAGLVIKAADSGRLLMTQRTPFHGDDDGAYGKWEFPGGSINDGEDPFRAALREFTEETGLSLPDGWKIADAYRGSNRSYVGIVVVVPNEAWTTDAELLDLETMGIGWFDEDLVADPNLAREEVAEGTDFEMVREAATDAVLLDEPEPVLDDGVAYGSESAGEFVPGDPRLAHLAPGAGEGQDNSDIAKAAQAFLQKAALKTFSPAEQMEIISEGESARLGASNTDRLDISGTFYESLEAADHDEIGFW